MQSPEPQTQSIRTLRATDVRIHHVHDAFQPPSEATTC
jgi:hypothetical protein